MMQLIAETKLFTKFDFEKSDSGVKISLINQSGIFNNFKQVLL